MTSSSRKVIFRLTIIRSVWRGNGLSRLFVHFRCRFAFGCWGWGRREVGEKRIRRGTLVGGRSRSPCGCPIPLDSSDRPSPSSSPERRNRLFLDYPLDTATRPTITTAPRLATRPSALTDSGELKSCLWSLSSLPFSTSGHSPVELSTDLFHCCHHSPSSRLPLNVQSTQSSSSFSDDVQLMNIVQFMMNSQQFRPRRTRSVHLLF